jgi:hypothetical protein
MSEPYIAPKEFEAVSQIFDTFCRKADVTVLAKAVEKHGSWEWAAVKQDDINRFVSLALTQQMEAVGGPRFYSVEVWAEAEARADRSLVLRSLISAFRTNDQVIPQPSFSEKLNHELEQAWRRATALHEHDLRPIVGSL